MISSIELNNFRGFSHLKMDNVTPITLISGMNNVGKSSVLDGLFLFFDHIDADSFIKLNRFRGLLSVYEPRVLWEPIFHNLNTQNIVQITLHLPKGKATLSYMPDDSFVVPKDVDIPINVLNQFISSTQSSYTLKFQYSYGDYWESGHFIANPSSGLLRNLDTSLEGNGIQPMSHTQFINNFIIIQTNGDVTSLLGNLELTNKKGELIEILKLIDPSISDIITIVTSSGAQIYFKMNGKMLPSKLAGDGLNKLMFIILSIMTNPNSLFLIDEIETGIHYSVYPDLWKVIAVAVQKYNCQVIATTHSYECIVGAVKGLESADLLNQFCYFRIDRHENDVTAYRYSDVLLRTAIDSGLEVR